eukprot:scaffold174816_cov54-Attheya_sp.AAC.3
MASFSSQWVTSVSCEGETINATQEALDYAYRSLQVCNEEDEESNARPMPIATPVTTHIDSDDPDDLAAAFFASQAKAKEAELQLPISEWSKVLSKNRDIHAILQRHGNNAHASWGTESLTNELQTTDELKAESDKSRTKVMAQLVYILYQDYQRGMLSS